MTKVTHKTVKVGDLDVFYRQAGPKDAPAILLLHGFPTSSQMFRNLIPALADEYHLISPDYPGFGRSSMPSRDTFAYTFDNLAKVIEEFTGAVGLTRYALYVQDCAINIIMTLITFNTIYSMPATSPWRPRVTPSPG
jgi:pimeloyl-ACP methyl ester carboxylesterase